MSLLDELALGIRHGSPALYWAVIAHLALIPLLVAGLAFDSRTVLGINPWIKPLKFFLSASIFMATTAWLLKDVGYPRAAVVIGWTVAVAMIVENSLISMQSFRGVRSHFNGASAFDAAVFSVMGLFIVLNTIAIAALALLYLMPGKALAPGYLWGVRLGLILFLAGSAESALMVRISGHTVGGADGGAGLPFLNWSTRLGDLRIAHFVGLHALQVLPVAGWVIDRLGTGYPAVAVLLAAVAYGGLFVVLTLQALSGKPLWF